MSVCVCVLAALTAVAGMTYSPSPLSQGHALSHAPPPFRAQRREERSVPGPCGAPLAPIPVEMQSGECVVWAGALLVEIKAKQTT